ncbi:ATP-dependent helicase [Flavobacterium zhairuonense]|uniref:UvrD-helicase domain-containing protein n=1 Tax=Flavobacterium zhairuonense TaxID=2493631 RepID=UPI00104F15D6|nr:ATP-dependent helicase [Flavobacterium zhairuonense]KAF2508720.1 ATP-dependent helicase [Flavobacterium zhairuonense]
MKPTRQQEAIIGYDDSCVVIAAPGSGKTFVISQKIKNNFKGLLEHQGVIAISYTNKASNELKRRSLSNGENPKSSFFGTIDKFNLSEIIVPFGKQLFGLPSAPIAVRKKSFIDTPKGNPLDWFDRHTSLDDLDREAVKQLASYFVQGIIFIETIGVFANYIFTKSLACRKYITAKYKYIYIDEYQDSGLQQHEIFLKIGSLGIKAIAVGDLNQSIYGFSGKDSKFLNELTQSKAFKNFKLNKNHRCDPSIINYSNYLLDPGTDLLEVNDGKNFVFFTRVKGKESEIAAWINSVLPVLMKEFKVETPSKIAVLTRGNRTGSLVSAALKAPHKLSVSTDLDTNLNIWSSIFTGLLYFIFDPSHTFVEVVEIFTGYDRLKDSDLKKLSVLKKDLKTAVADKKRLSAPVLEKIFIEIARVIAPDLYSGESIILLREVLDSSAYLKSYEPAADDEINILTLHKSKGLEYDVVIHLDLHKWVFPAMGPKDGKDWKNPEYLSYQQDLNLHYVGVTRARKACVLVSSTQRTNDKGEVKEAEDSVFIWLNDIKDLRCKN